MAIRLTPYHIKAIQTVENALMLSVQSPIDYVHVFVDEKRVRIDLNQTLPNGMLDYLKKLLADNGMKYMRHREDRYHGISLVVNSTTKPNSQINIWFDWTI